MTISKSYTFCDFSCLFLIGPVGALAGPWAVGPMKANVGRDGRFSVQDGNKPAREGVLTPSANKMQFSSKDGWFQSEDQTSPGSFDYMRLNKDGNMAYERFCESGANDCKRMSKVMKRVDQGT